LSAWPDNSQGQFLWVDAQKPGLEQQSVERLSEKGKSFDSLILMTRQSHGKKAELSENQQNSGNCDVQIFIWFAQGKCVVLPPTGSLPYPAVGSVSPALKRRSQV
jgi:hypothetical protein